MVGGSGAGRAIAGQGDRQMSAGTRNVFVEQGTDWRRDWVLKDANGDPCDLSGYTSVSAYCGRTYNDPNAVTMAATFIDALGAEAVNGDTTGTIRTELTAAQTSSLAWTAGYYDVYLTEPSGDRIRILKGQMTVAPKVPASTA